MVITPNTRQRRRVYPSPSSSARTRKETSIRSSKHSVRGPRATNSITTSTPRCTACPCNLGEHHRDSLTKVTYPSSRLRYRSDIATCHPFHSSKRVPSQAAAVRTRCSTESSPISRQTTAVWRTLLTSQGPSSRSLPADHISFRKPAAPSKGSASSKSLAKKTNSPSLGRRAASQRVS